MAKEELYKPYFNFLMGVFLGLLIDVDSSDIAIFVAWLLVYLVEKRIDQVEGSTLQTIEEIRKDKTLLIKGIKATGFMFFGFGVALEVIAPIARFLEG